MEELDLERVGEKSCLALRTEAQALGLWEEVGERGSG